MLGKIVKENIFLILAIALTAFALLPLFQPGFFSIHDDEQIGRLFELDQALKSGQFPVRIIANLGFGFSYLLFNFYPPFVYYLGEFFKLLSFSYIDSMKIVIGLGFVGSAFFMYLLGREYFGKLGGLVSAVLYVYAPYHAIDAYVRGAIPELFSFVFLPAVFWAYKKLADEPSKRYVILASIFNVLLVLTHNLVAMMASVFILAYLIFLFWKTKGKKGFVKNVGLTLIFSVLISSFFLIPALLENKYTMASLLTKELADYNYHFVYLRQLWDSPWGYGGSILGLEDGLSFQVGKLHIILSFIAILTALFLWTRKKIIYIAFLFFALFSPSVFLQTFHSKFIWDSLPPLHFIQFPWRFLLFSVFFSSLLGGFVVSEIKNKQLSLLASFTIIVLVILLNKNYFKPEKYLYNTDPDYINKQTLNWETSRKAFEYVPAGIATLKSPIGNSVVDISEENITKEAFSEVSAVLSGKTLKDKPNKKEISVEVEKGGIMQINTFAYPQWKVYVDGQKTSIQSNNKLKLIRFEIPKGRHDILLRFEETTIEKVSNFLSIAGIALILFYGLVYRDPTSVRRSSDLRGAR